VEVSFKNGARKDFFFMDHTMSVVTGDMIVVNSGNGYDVGRLSLTGDLVSLQMKKKKVKDDRVQHNVIRKANERDLEKLQEARDQEIATMVRARAIARTLNLDMKLGDVEFQGDKRKATFYYTAEGRIDFRELVRSYAREFKVKIEMRQIGSRQESARIGGIGSCGRELCCSTWLTDFKSVSTTAARYQYMAINQSKLSGQCGRLKCCLNYELDNYMDAISHFPEKADYIQTADGKARLMKIDIFKGLMYYSVMAGKGRSTVVAMDKEDVKKVIEMNKNGEKPASLASLQNMAYTEEVEDTPDYEDVTGAVELPDRKRRNKRRNKNKPKGNSPRGKKQTNNSSKEKGQEKQSSQQRSGDKKPTAKKKNYRKNRGKRKNDGQNAKQNSAKPTSDNKPNNNTKD
jgi:cell fate regulator YaaT (PSP1 superfamily)